jgi:acyl-CoA thioester hydrolase
MKALVVEEVRIAPQFYDLDPMNIVWHGNYARFFEIARTALLQRIGYGYEAMVAGGHAWPIVDMHMRYYRPLRLAQPAVIAAGLVEWENRLKVNYLIRDEKSADKLTKGHTVQVALEIKTERMLWETPAVFRDRLKPFIK